MLIRIQDLGFRYAPGTPLERSALQGANLEIAPHERVGILGPTGSGKSTLVQLMAGVLKPTAGRVWLDDVVAHGRTAASRAQRRRLGLAFQYPEHQIFQPTVFREVAYGPRNLGLDPAEIQTRVRWALDTVGLELEHVQGRSPLTLSGGEMRRLALASILAMRPDVLILDEPTAGLDPQGRRALLARMLEWQQATGATLLAVSHDLDELARVVDRVVLLASGQIIADGPTRRILSDHALLRAVGLDVPQPVAVLQALRAAGWQVRTDCLLPEEAAAEIARARALREVPA